MRERKRKREREIERGGQAETDRERVIQLMGGRKGEEEVRETKREILGKRAVCSRLNEKERERWGGGRVRERGRYNRLEKEKPERERIKGRERYNQLNWRERKTEREIKKEIESRPGIIKKERKIKTYSGRRNQGLQCNNMNTMHLESTVVSTFEVLVH